MRQIFVFTHVSLDGYFEAPEHDISWFNDDDHHFEAFAREQASKVDTLLFGRRTYELMKSFWPTPYAYELQPEVAEFMNEKRKIVFSHTRFEPGWKNVELICEDAIGAVKKLKQQAGGTIGMFGSNNLCVSLMQAGLIDEFRVVINPIALGAGTSLFAGLPARTSLSLKETTKFDESGKMLMIYSPA